MVLLHSNNITHHFHTIFRIAYIVNLCGKQCVEYKKEQEDIIILFNK
jgi:hypothetical protein